MQTIHLHRDNIEVIKKFIDKYPDSYYLTLTSDDSSGIGSIVKCSIEADLNGDHVAIVKTLVDESSW